MYMILYFGVFYVTDTPTRDGDSLWGYLIQLHGKFCIHIITHQKKEISSLAFGWEWGIWVMAKLLKRSMAADPKTPGITYLNISTIPSNLIPDT